ncbi:MAG: hypothetical protein MR357_09280, partial [Anaeroplasma sp.]|nr:hypothetical protein [Anaeroplasma sp.]
KELYYFYTLDVNTYEVIFKNERTTVEFDSLGKGVKFTRKIYDGNGNILYLYNSDRTIGVDSYYTVNNELLNTKEKSGNNITFKDSAGNLVKYTDGTNYFNSNGQVITKEEYYNISTDIEQLWKKSFEKYCRPQQYEDYNITYFKGYEDDVLTFEANINGYTLSYDKNVKKPGDFILINERDTLSVSLMKRVCELAPELGEYDKIQVRIKGVNPINHDFTSLKFNGLEIQYRLYSEGKELYYFYTLDVNTYEVILKNERTTVEFDSLGKSVKFTRKIYDGNGNILYLHNSDRTIGVDSYYTVNNELLNTIEKSGNNITFKDRTGNLVKYTDGTNYFNSNRQVITKEEYYNISTDIEQLWKKSFEKYCPQQYEDYNITYFKGYEDDVLTFEANINGYTLSYDKNVEKLGDFILNFYIL